MSKAIKELISKREQLESSKSDIDIQIAEVDKEIASATIKEYTSQISKQAPKKRQAKPRGFNHEATAARYEDFEPAETGCLCGCGEHVPEGSLFVKGHWRNLESIARAFEAGKLHREKMSQAGYNYAVTKGWINA